MSANDSLSPAIPPTDAASEPTPDAARFAVSRAAYLAVGLFAICLTVLVRSPFWLLIYLLPIALGFAVARTSTVVDAEGITVRALLGKRRMPWEQIRGLNVSSRAVYAVLADGAVRLPCVRIADLHTLSVASGDHLPALRRPVPKYAPQRHRRR